jgi:hypothetical protein
MYMFMDKREKKIYFKRKSKEYERKLKKMERKDKGIKKIVQFQEEYDVKQYSKDE